MIRLDRVSKQFRDAAQPALREVSWSAEPGEFVAIVGGSGSGKTTSLKCINRLVEPDHGAVFVGGEAVSSLAPYALRRRIGYVFQGIGLFPHLSVAANIGITPTLLGWDRERIAARVRELLELVELPAEYAERPPSALSGGQRQRVGVARALAAEPMMVLMDEPFGALDPLTRDTLGRAYRRLHEHMRLTTIMVTHDMLEALLLADRIIVMQRGAIIADGTPRALYHERVDPAVRELLDMPRKQASRVQALIDGHDAHDAHDAHDVHDGAERDG